MTQFHALDELIPNASAIKSNIEKRNLDSVQMLRGVAALLVAFAHLHAIEAKLGGSIIFGQWSLGGFAGVDIFFVISGFVMYWTNQNNLGNAVTVPRFWVLRLVRIYPIWLLICGAIYGVYLVHPDWVYQSHQSNPDILKSFLLLPQKELPLHAVGWTLTHELWFYLVFGVVIFLPKKYFAHAIVLWAAIIIFATITGFAPTSPELLLFTNPLGLEFIAGILAAFLCKKIPDQLAKGILIIGVISFVLAMFAHATNANIFFAQYAPRVYTFAIPSFLIILGLAKSEQLGMRIPNPFIKLGDWSYALYLIHVPVFALTGRIFARFSKPNSVFDNLIFCAIALIGAIIAAAILHIAFEKPIMKMAHKLLPMRHSK
jgi:exopolysaccharide production protein ExoZ